MFYPKKIYVPFCPINPTLARSIKLLTEFKKLKIGQYPVCSARDFTLAASEAPAYISEQFTITVGLPKA